MQKQVYLQLSKWKQKSNDQNKIDARTFQCQGCGGNNNSESVRSWNIYWTSWNSTKLQKYFLSTFHFFQQKQPSPVRPSARIHSRNSLSLESKSPWPVQIQSWYQSADPITKSTCSEKIFFLWEKNQTKNVILGDAGHYRPRDQRMPPCAGGLHQLQGFFIH